MKPTRSSLEAELDADVASARASGTLVLLCTASRKLSIGERSVKLTPTELLLVQLLRRHGGRTVSRRAACVWIWGHSSESYERRLQILVRRLRDHLGVDRELVETVRSSGVRWRVAGLE